MSNQSLLSPAKIVFVLFAATIASLGTMPYGFRFVNVFGFQSEYAIYISGITLAITAALANIALGFYSLLHMELRFNEKYSYLNLIALIGAIPTAFICYFGYYKSLPVWMSLVITMLVMLMNGAIGYTALYNFITFILDEKITRLNLTEKAIRILAFLIGLVVSLSIFMAAIHGIKNLLLFTKMNFILANVLANILGFIAWLPYAVLFSNSMQIAAGKIFHSIAQHSFTFKQLKFSYVVILFVAVCSGASFAEIAREFFAPSMDIPLIFKKDLSQLFIYYFLVPFAFISSVAVNYLGLLNAVAITQSMRVQEK